MILDNKTLEKYEGFIKNNQYHYLNVKKTFSKDFIDLNSKELSELMIKSVALDLSRTNIQNPKQQSLKNEFYNTLLNNQLVVQNIMKLNPEILKFGLDEDQLDLYNKTKKKVQVKNKANSKRKNDKPQYIFK